MDRGSIQSGAIAAALLAGAAGAGDKGSFQVTPYLGMSSVKVEGRYLEFGTTDNLDQWQAGIAASYRAPFGLVLEIGKSATGDLYIGWLTGGEVRETYGAVGYDFRLAHGWHLAPKIGLTRWRLEGSEFEDLVGDSGELRESLDGDDPYVELAVDKEFNPHIGIGLSLRHADVEFGHVQSIAFKFIWTL